MDFISIQPFVLRNLAALSDMSLITYGLIFLGGIATALSPCYIPILIMFGSYVGGFPGARKKAMLSVALPFTAGTVLALGIVGIIAGFIGTAIMTLLTGFSLDRLIPGILGLVMGLQLLGVYKLNLPVFRGFKLPKATGGKQAFALGLPFGLVVTPCTIPIFLAVLGFVVGRAGVLYGATLMIAFALGRTVPLLAVAASAGALSFLRRGKLGKYFERASGLIIILASLYILFLT